MDTLVQNVDQAVMIYFSRQLRNLMGSLLTHGCSAPRITERILHNTKAHTKRDYLASSVLAFSLPTRVVV